ncbi:MAG: hypothetical protein H6964_10565 [Chromatiaceae bacterium]|nr:hypothetical protein [Gammaproteobacteria bacterium]MCB1880923.1 hypothetical protein [Gammaproteobacteria bacterium]MCP5428486.1 hypothetical protein [Chromatiaceae bacterium]MCP5447422.1 hypothetical protein [Chromatiaceae bacterium]
MLTILRNHGSTPFIPMSLAFVSHAAHPDNPGSWETVHRVVELLDRAGLSTGVLSGDAESLELFRDELVRATMIDALRDLPKSMAADEVDRALQRIAADTPILVSLACREVDQALIDQILARYPFLYLFVIGGRADCEHILNTPLQFATPLDERASSRLWRRSRSGD